MKLYIDPLVHYHFPTSLAETCDVQADIASPQAQAEVSQNPGTLVKPKKSLGFIDVHPLAAIQVSIDFHKNTCFFSGENHQKLNASSCFMSLVLILYKERGFIEWDVSTCCTKPKPPIFPQATIAVKLIHIWQWYSSWLFHVFSPCVNSKSQHIWICCFYMSFHQSGMICQKVGFIIKSSQIWVDFVHSQIVTLW